MATGQAAPGTVVPTGAFASPGGAQGTAGGSGKSAYTTTSAAFTVPAYGSSTTVNVLDTSWVAVGEMVNVDQAGGGPGLAGALQVTAKTATQLTLLNPTPAPAIPLAGSTQPGLMGQTSGNSTDYIGGDNQSHNLVTAVQPTIWSARLRSFNAIGNPNFGIDQRTAGVGLASGTFTSTFAQDRWGLGVSSASMTFKAVQTAGRVNLPGTNFCITQNFLRVTLTAQETALSSGSAAYLYTQPEGIMLRELCNDVHSIAVLVRSSAAPVNVGVILQDPNQTYSLNLVAAIPTANTWTLVPLPNLPIWTPSVTWSTLPGVQGYFLFIGLAAGSSETSPSVGSWISGNYYGSQGQSNFAANPVGSTLDVAFVQHEPGNQCTTLIDKPWTQNYDECLRYFQKSYPYATPIGTVTPRGQILFYNTLTGITNYPYGGCKFPKPMALDPTVVIYNAATGAQGNVNSGPGSTFTVQAVQSDATGMSYLQVNNTPANTTLIAQYTADTGF